MKESKPLKLIHLSDLHLGKRVNEFSMLEDQFTRITFSYDDSMGKLVQVKTKDLDGGANYYTMDFIYEEL